MKAPRYTLMIMAVIVCAMAVGGCIVVVPGGCSRETVSGSGNVVAQTRDLPVFKRIRLKGAGHVTLTQGDNQSVVIESDDNILPLIRTRVDGGTLEISHESYNLRPTKLEYRLTASEISGVSISGSADVEGQGAIAADAFEADISGSGDMRLDLAASRLTASIKGSVMMVVSGTADEQHSEIKGSGDIQAFELLSKRVAVTIAGSGDCRVRASDELRAEISGSGDVLYRGRPRIESDIKGSGSVKAQY